MCLCFFISGVGVFQLFVGGFTATVVLFLGFLSNQPISTEHLACAVVCWRVCLWNRVEKSDSVNLRAKYLQAGNKDAQGSTIDVIPHPESLPTGGVSIVKRTTSDTWGLRVVNPEAGVPQ